MVKVTFLGTGTSHGVPMIGCDCGVCRSDDDKDKRTRSSILVEVDGVYILVDTTPELRIQALREGIRQVDAVLFTHAHADHLFGLDDIRRFNVLKDDFIQCYGSPETLMTVRKAFEYVFIPTQIGGGKPMLELVEVEGPFEHSGVEITPVPVRHGKVKVYGYRIGDFAYVTDCSMIPVESKKMLQNLDTLVLGALRPRPHETHFSLSQALATVEDLKPNRAFFTHIAHKMEHESTNRALPLNVQL